MQMFKGCKSEDMPPHIYSTTQTAYRNMLATRQDQALVLLGRSGSGKSCSMKHSLHYLTSTAGSVNHTFTGESEVMYFCLQHKQCLSTN